MFIIRNCLLMPLVMFVSIHIGLWLVWLLGLTL